MVLAALPNGSKFLFAVPLDPSIPLSVNSIFSAAHPVDPAVVVVGKMVVGVNVFVLNNVITILGI
jgi:hypothetical protein